MRNILFVFLSITSVGAYGQTKTTNNIKEVDVMNIYGPNANIKIGEVKVYPTLETKLYLIKATVEKDTSGNYVSRFYFGNNENLPVFNVRVALIFNQPIIRFWKSGGSGMSTGFESSSDLKYAEFTASQINRPFGGGNQLFTLVVLSKTKLSTKIEGIAGELKEEAKP